MTRRPLLLALVLLAALLMLPATAGAAARCTQGADEIRFDDGRLRVMRTERAVNPGGTVRERWWSCWRPTGRRALIADVRHAAGVDERALLAVRRGRFVALGGGGRLDVLDGRTGRLTATLELRGALRELAVTAHGRAAALVQTAPSTLELLAADGTRGCLQDAGAPSNANGDVFGGLTVSHERVAWHKNGVALAADLTHLEC